MLCKPQGWKTFVQFLSMLLWPLLPYLLGFWLNYDCLKPRLQMCMDWQFITTQLVIIYKLVAASWTSLWGALHKSLNNRRAAWGTYWQLNLPHPRPVPQPLSFPTSAEVPLGRPPESVLGCSSTFSNRSRFRFHFSSCICIGTFASLWHCIYISVMQWHVSFGMCGVHTSAFLSSGLQIVCSFCVYASLSLPVPFFCGLVLHFALFIHQWRLTRNMQHHQRQQ